MRLRLEPRREASRAMLYGTPVLAVALTVLAGILIFSLMGYDGLAAIYQIFVAPIADPYRWQDLFVKAAPLITIALGLAIGFRANVWNIGAEGQYIVGALAGTGVALATWDMEGYWILPAMVAAGILGGLLWAAIPAFLKTRFNVNEILTSLMLTYVAVQLLYYLMRGPWRDPEGYGFPQTRLFSEWQTLPTVVQGTLVHLGVPVAFFLAIVVWVVLSRTVTGFQVRVVGLAPQAARYGGFSARGTVWLTLLTSGAFAGLAGIFEAAGPFQQMTPQFSVNYGFTAIIVAFLGRLHPLGIVLAGMVLAVSYVGGENAQTALGLPYAATGMFQAMMLFFLLAVDILVRYRLRVVMPADLSRPAEARHPHIRQADEGVRTSSTPLDKHRESLSA
ncbi:simple sugar transport system permease protein [Rhodopseudomonas julia]|uniref:Simple sugar transport system permease protein n=1 Tax=Rhodopseudomonas julia TaxID=200617 RepID=A0ABU0C3B6_9BRAD|nr:ABC transporter permease [Rhodopseudomonas julia]MDQ0324970.1 simple sugar transport system permease protein [Rhodopseudomonas julia]